MNYDYIGNDCQPCVPEEDLRVEGMRKAIDELHYRVQAITSKLTRVADATFGSRPETKQANLSAVGNAPSVHNSINQVRDALDALTQQVERF